MTTHLLDLADLGVDGIDAVIDLAQRPIAELGRPLSGAGAALIFEKPSARTRHSMEMAVHQLGGHPVYTRGDEVGFDVREPVEDITRVLAGYHALLGARVFHHAVVERMAAVSDVPVVNMLSDRSHPLQALADVLTMTQVHGPLAGSAVAWVGDFNNVARSLAEACVLLGANVRVASPDGYGPADDEVRRIDALGPGSATRVERAADAVRGAVAVHTDTWTSMGQEGERDRRLADFAGYTVDATLLASAAPDAGFYHCMPAHRGEEVERSVIDGPRSHVVHQAHNRLHAARGALAHVLGTR